MAYRSSKEKAENRVLARRLYVKEGVSFEDISQATGETVRTLKTWCKLGQWDTLKYGIFDPDRDRLRTLRASLFDRIEAHLKESKLPHVEIDLLAKVDRMLARQEAKVRADPGLTTLIALETLLDDLQEHDPALKSEVAKHLPRIGKRIRTRGYPDLMDD